MIHRGRSQDRNHHLTDLKSPVAFVSEHSRESRKNYHLNMNSFEKEEKPVRIRNRLNQQSIYEYTDHQIIPPTNNHPNNYQSLQSKSGLQQSRRDNHLARIEKSASEMKTLSKLMIEQGSPHAHRQNPLHHLAPQIK